MGEPVETATWCLPSLLALVEARTLDVHKDFIMAHHFPTAQVISLHGVGEVAILGHVAIPGRHCGSFSASVAPLWHGPLAGSKGQVHLA